jgi:poly(A) polymerase
VSDPVAIVRVALGGEPAWIVGGAVRDRLLGDAAPVADLDVALDGDPAAAARAIARASGRGTAHVALSDA